MRIIIIKVMHNSIPKIRCKHFAFLRVSYNKTSGGIRFVGSAVEFITKRIEVALQIGFKS